MRKPSPTDFNDIRRTAITAVFSDDFLFERVVLKGGNALAIALGIGTRTSLDLDFSIENDFDDPAEVGLRLEKALKNRFATIGQIVFDFQFGPRPRTPREQQNPRWGGYTAGFKLLSSLRHGELGGNLSVMRREATTVGPSQERVFTIDLSKFEYTTGKIATDLDDFQIYVYAPEMIAAEKLRAICQQMPEYTLNRVARARARDFFDIHLILTVTGLDIASARNLDLIRNIFAAKDVPLALLTSIADQREFHRPDWDSVRISVEREELREFDFYFDFVLSLIARLKTLWE